MFLKINVNKENGTYVYVMLWSSSGDSASCHLNPWETSVFIPDLLNFSCSPLNFLWNSLAVDKQNFTPRKVNVLLLTLNWNELPWTDPGFLVGEIDFLIFMNSPRDAGNPHLDSPLTFHNRLLINSSNTRKFARKGRQKPVKQTVHWSTCWAI